MYYNTGTRQCNLVMFKVSFMATVGSKRIRVTRVFVAVEEVGLKTCGVKIVT